MREWIIDTYCLVCEVITDTGDDDDKLREALDPLWNNMTQEERDECNRRVQAYMDSKSE